MTLLLYYVLPRRLRNPVLLVMSLLFYGWGEPRWVIILVFSSVLDFCCSNVIERNRGNGRPARRRKTALVTSVVLNLGILCFFKYGGFLLDSLVALPFLPADGWWETAARVMEKNVRLPIGISFYTFQTMSCTIDVYRGEAKAQKSIVDFATYVALFPQLIAGPIVRYEQIADQLTGRKESVERVAAGILTFGVGLCKKVLLANQFGALWDEVQAMAAPPAATALFGLLCFTLQIYFDFSGYSDMAIGLGRFFGFELPINFRYPYTAKSITEFWRRWHISLGMWFREYVYIPLGGNRGGAGRMLRNIFVVWFLTGLWHGASWNFVLWGLYYGVLLLVEKVALKPLAERAYRRWPGKAQGARRLLAAGRHVYTLCLVVFGWALFSFTDFGELRDFLAALFGANGWIAAADAAGLLAVGTQGSWLLYHLWTCLPLLVCGAVGCTPLPRRLWQRLSGGDTKEGGRGAWLGPLLAVLALLVCTAYLVNASYNPFLYFRF